MDLTPLYKISVNVPSDFSDKLMDEITELIEPLYPGYDRTFTIIPVTGTWRPLKSSNPYRGEINKIEIAEEIKIEFAIEKKDINIIIDKLKEIHPYEEPAIDVIPMFGWRDFILPLA